MTDRDALAELSEGQRRCLRMVLELKSSKDIGRELGISRHTVDQRLKRAMKSLGAANRVEAARIHAGLESAPGYQRLINQSSDIAEDAHPATMAALAGDKRSQANAVGEEKEVPYRVSTHSTGQSEPKVTKGVPRTRLGIWQRLGWIFLVAIASMIAFGTLLAGFHALVEVASERGRLPQ